MIQPVELRETAPKKLRNGGASTTTEVWDMLVASRSGDLDRVKALVSANPALVQCEFNYTPPLHFAVREGHVDLTRYLLEHGALDPKYRTYPFLDTLPVMAQDRGYDAISRLLEEHLRRPDLQSFDDVPDAPSSRDPERRRFQSMVDKDDLAGVEARLQERPELARDELAFWGEGILMMPAKCRQRAMVELLLRYGARVPDVSKWGREYYFKHDDMAAFLLARGMNPNHMTWQHVTLLHDMAQLGHLERARLLLDHGADINPLDEEYRSTPLGLAARWGQREMVDLLLSRGADPTKAGASWATPLAWARAKGYRDIEDLLR